jgi:hypothetical protein
LDNPMINRLAKEVKGLMKKGMERESAIRHVAKGHGLNINAHYELRDQVSRGWWSRMFSFFADFF